MENANKKFPELRGKIIAMMPPFTSPSGFTKRDIVIETGYKYPNPIKVTFKKERADALDDYAEGDTVIIPYALDGRQWDGPKGTQFFVDISAMGIERFGAAAEQKKPILGATKEAMVEKWLKANPGDKDLKLLAKFCKAQKPGKASKDYTIADWADILNAFEGEAQAAADAAKGADDIDDLPF